MPYLHKKTLSGSQMKLSLDKAAQIFVGVKYAKYRKYKEHMSCGGCLNTQSKG